MAVLEAHELPLHKVFSSDFDFHIPDYQRPYAWEPEQVTQLLSDLTDALNSGVSEPYFLGSVVLVKTESGPQAEVIDGQQRLTSLSLLLAVLRDITSNPELRPQVQNMLSEPGALALQLSPKPRLRLRERDAKFFAKHVQAPGSIPGLVALGPDDLATDAQRCLRANAVALHEILTKWDEQRRLDLLTMLSLRTYLVVVSTPSLESAHRIFSVMNARGMDLTPADIFKSKVIGVIQEGRDKYAALWEEAEQDLGRDDFVDLFQHLRVIYSGERAKVELLKEFDQQVLQKFLPGRATDFVDDVLVPYARIYQEVQGENYRAANGTDMVNAWLRRLNLLEHNEWRPSVLWAIQHHRGDAEWLTAFLRQLDRLAASLLIRRVNATPRNQRFVDLTRQLTEGHGLNSPALTLSPDETAETLERLDGPVYQVTRIRKYVLLRLDEALAKDAGVNYDHRIITVEHVLPQHPDENSVWRTDFTLAERTHWTHRIGNLVLLNRAKNSEAQNYDFTKKKARYFSGRNGVAPFALTVGVVSHPTWTPDVLQERQKLMLTTLGELWELAGSPE